MANNIDLAAGLNLTEANKQLAESIALMQTLYKNTTDLNSAITAGTKTVKLATEAANTRAQAIKSITDLQTANTKVLNEYKTALASTTTTENKSTTATNARGTSIANATTAENKATVSTKSRNTAISDLSKTESDSATNEERLAAAYNTQASTIAEASAQNKLLGAAIKELDLTTEEGRETTASYTLKIAENKAAVAAATAIDKIANTTIDARKDSVKASTDTENEATTAVDAKKTALTQLEKIEQANAIAVEKLALANSDEAIELAKTKAELQAKRDEVNAAAAAELKAVTSVASITEAYNTQATSLTEATAQNKILKAAVADLDLSTESGRDTLESYSTKISENKALIAEATAAEKAATDELIGKKTHLTEVEKLEIANTKAVEQYEAANSAEAIALAKTKAELASRRAEVTASVTEEIKAEETATATAEAFSTQATTVADATEQNKLLKTAVTELDLSTESGRDALESYSAKIAENKVLIAEATEAEKAATASLADKTAEITGLDKLELAAAEAAAQYEIANSDEAVALAKVKAELAARRAEVNSNAKADVEAAESVDKADKAYAEEVTSLREATAQNKTLRTATKDLDLTTEEGRETLEKYNERIDENSEFIRINSDELTQQKINVGNYSSAISESGINILELAKQSETAGGATALFTTGLKSAITSMKALTVSTLTFLATPIGAVLGVMAAAFLVIKNAVDRSETSSAALKKGFASLTGITSTLLNALLPLGDFLINTLVVGLEGLEKGVTGALGAIASGLDKLGFDKSAENLASFNEELESNIAAAKEITDLELAYAEAQRESQKVTLEYQTAAERLRQTRDDETLSLKERIAANEELGIVLEEQKELEVSNATAALELAEKKIQLNGETVASLDELAAAETELADIVERVEGFQSEQLINKVQLQKEVAAEQKAASDAEIAQIEAVAAAQEEAEQIAAEARAAQSAAIEEQIDTEFEAEADAAQAILDLQQETLNKKQELAEQELEILQEKIDEELEMRIEAQEAIDEINEAAKEQYQLDVQDSLETLQTAIESADVSALAIYTALEDVATNAFDNITDAQITSIDEQLDALEDQRDEEGNLSDEEQAEYEALTIEKAKIERKAAVYEKATAISSAVISTAQSVIAMLKSGVSGIPLSIAAAATGAASIATIAAEPLPEIPSFFKGTNYAPKGIKLVGEKGTEAIEKNGSVYFTPAEPTLIDTAGGERILTHEQTIAKYGQQQSATDMTGVESRLDKLNKKKQTGLTYAQLLKSQDKQRYKDRVRRTLKN